MTKTSHLDAGAKLVQTVSTVSSYPFLQFFNLACQAASRKAEDAPIAVVFSVCALEGFINTLISECLKYAKHGDSTLDKLNILLSSAEDVRASIKSKIDLIYLEVTGKRPNSGKTHFQQLEPLIRLRNLIVHNSPESLMSVDSNLPERKQNIKRLITTLGEYNVFKKADIQDQTWSTLIKSRYVSYWAVKTVNDCLSETIDLFHGTSLTLDHGALPNLIRNMRKEFKKLKVVTP